MACDIRLMSDRAVLMAGYPRIGGSPDGGLTWTLPQAMGYEKTIRFLLENKTVDAAEAERLGLVGEVVPAETFADRLAEYSEFLCSRSPITMRLTKRTVSRATRDIDVEAQLRLELNSIRMAFSSEDGKEARKAFMEKRQPQFQGK
jgi:2-(1,2-epoxy-1,2-dihydrophenyl)acetyl-CoA isomerase